MDYPLLIKQLLLTKLALESLISRHDAVAEAIEKTSVGKVDKKLLRQKYAL